MTSITRRKILGAASASAAFLATPSWAQPKGPVKLVVGYPPGGPADVIARALVESLKASLGVSVVVDNRPGAGGRVAADQVRNAATDGSVLLVTPASVVTLAPHLFKSVRYELERDFMPLVPIARLDLGIYVGAGTPEGVKTLADLIKWLQDNPKSRSCGIPGIGSTPHLAAMLLGKQAQLDWTIVPYQGDAPNFLALLSGEVPVGVSSLAGGMEHLKAGKLRLLALSTSERSSFMPQIPTLSQAGYDIVVEDRHCVVGPKQMSPTTVALVRDALNKAMQTKEFGELLHRMSLQASNPSSDFPAALKAETQRWEKSVKALNLTME